MRWILAPIRRTFLCTVFLLATSNLQVDAQVARIKILPPQTQSISTDFAVDSLAEIVVATLMNHERFLSPSDSTTTMARFLSSVSFVAAGDSIRRVDWRLVSATNNEIVLHDTVESTIDHIRIADEIIESVSGF